mgnify:CR=1 FL=1
MAYIRGPIYIWPSQAHTHFWSAAGADGWRESGWGTEYEAQAADANGPAGVRISQSEVDEFVVMRFAELLDERALRATVDRAITNSGDNGGCAALVAHARRLLRVMQ